MSMNRRVAGGLFTMTFGLLMGGCAQTASMTTEVANASSTHGKPTYIGRAQDLYDLTPLYQPDTYRNMDQLYFTRDVARGEQVYPLPQLPNINVTYQADGALQTTDDFMRRNRVGGVLIIKDGNVVLEKYGLGSDANTRWTSFSVVKSISSSLVGAAVQQGRIDVKAPITQYLPALAGGAYDGVTVEQVLHMSSGADWNETYRDPTSDRREMFERQLSNTPGSLVEQMSHLKRKSKPGTVFKYSTGESHLQSELIHAATGMTTSDYLSDRIWARMGMEQSAYWQLDAQAGQEIGSSGFSATLKDYGRFGQFILNDGVINGERILPVGWMDKATEVDPASYLAPGKLYGGDYILGYGYQWWLFPTGSAARDQHDGAFEAQGIFGQFVYINPKENLVAVVWSAWPEPEMDKQEMETYDFIAAAIKALK
jgi:CubicO group peptidase (beta-lactamase class C family)